MHIQWKKYIGIQTPGKEWYTLVTIDFSGVQSNVTKSKDLFKQQNVFFGD